MKIEGKFIFKVAGTLTAISLVVALLLGLTNMLTADKIAAIGAKRIEINNIGPVIGAHSGPGTVALFFTGNDR